MDVQLQELIDKIKKDGVASAQQEALAIKEAASKEAESIIAQAKEQAQGIIKDAKAETERMEKAGCDAIKQASRNLLLSFRDGISAQVRALVETQTNAALDKDLLAKLIPETVKAWVAKSESTELAVLLPENNLKELESAVAASLKEEMSKGLEIRPDKTLSAGFRIGLKDGSSYYDYSAEAVAELLAAYLNPKISGIMKEAAKE